MLSASFIRAQQSPQFPAKNGQASNKELMVVRRAMRIDRKADLTATRHPVIQIELHSERLFDGLKQIHSLRIGSHVFTHGNGSLGQAVYELTPQEFAKTRTGDEVVVRYRATNPIHDKKLLQNWSFGRLDKNQVNQNPVKTFEGTSIGDSPSYSRDGRLIHAGLPIKIRSRTRDTRTNIPIISVTDENIFPQHWLSRPIQARATPLSRKELKRSIYILDVAMSKYPILTLRENIKVIYLLNSLSLYGIAADGTFSSDSIYIVNAGDKEYTDEYLESSFHRAFDNLMLQKNHKGEESSRWPMPRLSPLKIAWELPAADQLMKLVYQSEEERPGYIYALENTGFTGVTLLKQFGQSPPDSAIRCPLRCQQTNPTPPALLQQVIKEHGYVLHKTVSEDAPVWSHDGKQIAFRSTRDSDSVELYLMQVDGSNLRRLTQPNPRSRSMVAAAIWSPDDRRLAYVLDDEGGSNLFVVNSDGSGQKRLSIVSGRPNGINGEGLSVDNVDRLLGWIPDGRILVVTESFASRRTLYSILPDGTGLTPLTENGQVVEDAVVSPDQNKVAIKTLGGLIIKDLKSNAIRSYVGHSGYGMSWSPDSKQIAYSAGGLMMMDVESGISHSCRINPGGTISTNPGGIVSGLVWSPDGKQIAYSLVFNTAVDSPSTSELWVANADGTQSRRLTTEAGPLVWSPDGKYIIFGRLQARLYLIRADGSGERYIAQGFYAKWIP